MRRLAPLLALCALAGCNLAPPHVRPPLPTAAAYPADYAAAGSGTTRATELDWRQFFADPRLVALIGLALQRNRDLAVSVARIEEARGQFRIIDADRYPSLDGSASVTRSRTSTGGLGVGGTTGTGTTTGTGSGGTTTTGGSTGTGAGTTLTSTAFTYTRYQVGVAVTSFELDFWGRVRNLSEAARARYFSTVQAERSFRLSLIRDVASAYLTARETDERILLAQRTLASRETGLRIAKRRLDAGVTSALDYRQAETLLTQAETQLAALRVTQAQTDNLLVTLIGGPPPGPLPEPIELEAQKLDRALTPGLPSDLLANRPDVIGAEETLRAARADIGAARAAFFPTISLTGTLGFASTALGDLFKSGGFQYSAGPSALLPIFDWGRNKGNLTIARADERIALAQYERAIQGAFQEVADALAGRKYLADQVEAQERAVTAQQQLAYLASTRYANGVANYLEVLDAQRNLFDAEQTLIQTRRLAADNLVNLYIALGGGLTPAPAVPEDRRVRAADEPAPLPR